MKYTIEKVTTLIGARRYGERDCSVAFLLTDSRSLCFPEETLFFALRSERNDGHNYIPELYRRGVRNFVVTSVPKHWTIDYPDANFLQVVNTLEALQRLAERHRDAFDIPIVGITGSNGKTMVKEWLYQLLAPKVVTRSPRSYNSQIGVPLSVWLLQPDSEVGIFEAGISKPGEMLALRDIIQPTIAVLTNVGAAHQENFPSRLDKCREKLLLFHNAQTIVFNADDPIIAQGVQEICPPGCERLAWSAKDPSAAFFVKAVEKKETITSVTYRWKGLDDSFALPFIDDASVTCAIVSAIIALHLGLSPHLLCQRIRRLEPVAMRLEVKEGQHGCTLINDSYNSDINSLDIALDFMHRRPDHKGRRRTLILSDIFQSGLPPQQLYAEVSRLARERGVNKFIGIGPHLCQWGGLIQIAEKFFFPSVSLFVASHAFRSLHDEVILLKGARQFGFDQLSELLVQKVHETTLEVNLRALVANLNFYRSFLAPTTKLVCMIKADAYGAGAVEIAKTLQDQRVDYLAVAVADEGVALRQAGISQSIIVMNPELSSFKALFDYDLEPEVYSFRLLHALIHAAQKEGISNFPVHIKLDTGMHRLGFNVEPVNDIPQLIAILRQQNAVIPRSVFSHFVGSDSPEFDDFSAHQFSLFLKASAQLQAAFDHKILRHIANSAAITHFPDRQLDMCRLGLGLYGVSPSSPELQPKLAVVSSLKTTILQLRHVKAGDSVGYSRQTFLTRDSLIAAIPIGYADGLNRLLGNRQGACIVNGQQAPYVGNICMDVAMIDVTDIPCQEGDVVEIFGSQMPVTSLSKTAHTIPYEVLTSISNRVKRVYFQD